jgi:4-amino-4-deoxy-L-arabinose transferase-like glycosyltransferase
MKSGDFPEQGSHKGKEAEEGIQPKGLPDTSAPFTPGVHLDISIDVGQDGRVRITIVPPAVQESHGSLQEHNEFKNQVALQSDGTIGEHDQVVMHITMPQDASRPSKSQTLPSRVFSWLRDRLGAWPLSLDMTLFGLALVLYMFTRIVGLDRYPIYFFSDEAVQTVLAVDFLRENFHSTEGELFPTYFYNVDKYSLSTTVYLQVLPYLLFGKSVLVTRMTSVLVTLLAATSVGLILRDILKLPYWWSATLLLSIAPAWFLHSRTAFETTTMVSFYVAGLYFYLRYRYGKPNYLYVSLILFALAFYSYNPGQVVVVLTGLLLLISDAGYHWRNRGTAIRGLGLLVLLSLPYLRFRLAHPTAFEDQLFSLGSYWVQSQPLGEKISKYFDEYLYGLSPGYWFIPNTRDLMRHRMEGYGLLLSATLPFAAVGLFQALRNFRSSAHRAVIISLLAAPAGAALVQVAVTRALTMVIAATLLTALGLVVILEWLEKRVPRRALSIILFVFLTLVSLNMTRDAIKNGPTWFGKYGLMGMQYGAAQVFEEVKDYRSHNPEAEILFSPTWANGTDVVARFFLHDPLPIQLASITEYMYYHYPLNEKMVFVMPVDEYELLTESGKFTEVQVDRTVPYPNGKPGFYFVRLSYVENIDEILAAEQAERRELRETDVLLNGKLAHVRHSMLDLGEVSNLWDGDHRSVTRTFEANPYVIEVSFLEPTTLGGMSLVIGDTEVKALVRLYDATEDQPVEFVFDGLKGSVPNPMVSINLGEPQQVSVLYLEVEDLHQKEPGHVHIWEIELYEGATE